MTRFQVNDKTGYCADVENQDLGTYDDACNHDADGIHVSSDYFDACIYDGDFLVTQQEEDKRVLGLYFSPNKNQFRPSYFLQT